MVYPDSLVDDETLSLFSSPSCFDISLLKNHLSHIANAMPKLNESKNYFSETHRNFIINKTPQKLDSLYQNVCSYFSKCINWNSPQTQFNITPPVVLPALVSSSIASFVNPNLVWDVASGGFVELERELVNYFSNLVGWNNALGLFTFGGTGTNMYAIKLGINKSNPVAFSEGVKEAIVISNNEGHSCHVTLCNWLGVGTKNCVRLNTSKEGILDIREFWSASEKILKEGKTLSCIIVNGGTNFNGEIDPIKNIAEQIDSLVKRFSLNYRPHLHVDSVIGWVFLLFKDYDFQKNELNFPNKLLYKIKLIYSKLSEITYADSFGIDFHKTGFCPYLSSLFIAKNKEDFKTLTEDKSLFTHQSFNFGEYKPGQFTLETSRPANGAISAYASLNALGLDGFRRIFANFLYLSEDLKTKLSSSAKFSLCNPDALGWATLFLIAPVQFNNGYSTLYESEDTILINKSNQLQTEFYNFLLKKYKNELPWNIGFSKCYKENKFGIKISALKNYPMSPFASTLDNTKFVNWLLSNLKEFNSETTPN